MNNQTPVNTAETRTEAAPPPTPESTSSLEPSEAAESNESPPQPARDFRPAGEASQNHSAVTEGKQQELQAARNQSEAAISSDDPEKVDKKVAAQVEFFAPLAAGLDDYRLEGQDAAYAEIEGLLQGEGAEKVWDEFNAIYDDVLQEVPELLAEIGITPDDFENNRENVVAILKQMGFETAESVNDWPTFQKMIAQNLPFDMVLAMYVRKQAASESATAQLDSSPDLEVGSENSEAETETQQLPEEKSKFSIKEELRSHYAEALNDNDLTTLMRAFMGMENYGRNSKLSTYDSKEATQGKQVGQQEMRQATGAEPGYLRTIFIRVYEEVGESNVPDNIKPLPESKDEFVNWIDDDKVEALINLFYKRKTSSDALEGLLKWLISESMGPRATWKDNLTVNGITEEAIDELKDELKALKARQ